ncbi:adenylate cyclase regulatory domain-containing protein [Agromyces sp. NPDC056523]|uniref:adenylate/guanylate cyclase domain-containing protein n=1 Tax=Agromyces sp. NPDC056523 TaxID=3345850 RepID=UPI00366E21AC
MTWCTREEAARRAGVGPEYVTRLVEVGLLSPEQPDRFSPGDVRRVQTARSLEDAGIALDDVVAAVERGSVSLDFLDAAAYERFAALAPETFRQVSDRTGVPLELLTVIREAIGMAEPSPDDLLRDDEMEVVPFIEFQLSHGFRATAIERLVRVYGDSVRRITEQEAAWWRSEVIAPALAAGENPDRTELADEIAPLADRAFMAVYHAQQARAWTANIIDTFETMLANAGIHSRLERLPAICFLDLVGFTRLTEELGDDAAADLAGTVALLVGRNSVQHGGKPIKWLGDGVMLHFGDPGRGVHAALGMVDELADAGLPPAHVGLHAGPILYQEGDYFGRTVNLSARIADYARPGEVLVTREVVDASRDDGIGFDDIGPVELKGVSGTVHLLRARTA